jgi:hypothetical protein
MSVILGIYRKLKKSYLKNFPEIFALIRGFYPEFVLERKPKTLTNEVPVFTFHSVEANRFEEQLEFLYKNGYQTLVADELYECLVGERPIPERSIVLTFDDGWKSLRTIAYPLLRKYGFRAVCFLIPGLIRDGKENNGNVVDRESGINSEDREELCSWYEVKEMHESGIIDFQSHSMYHSLVFVSSRIEDFFHPFFDSFAMNLNVPIFKKNGVENVSRHIQLGNPIYGCASRFSGKRRYLDDEGLRNRCIEYVSLNGGKEFFRDHGWRGKLKKIIREYRQKYGDKGYFESEEELRENLYNDLLESKCMIEKKLPGKTVNHFCYPWWEGSDIAVEMSKKAGYLTNFWGILPGRRTNRCGDDPYRIVRMLSDDYIFRLPGDGRKSLLKIIGKKFLLNYKRFAIRLVQID